MKGTVKTGIIGLGVMGQGHWKTLSDNVSTCEVTAVCDANPARFAEAAKKGLLGEKVKRFSTHEELIQSESCEAVLVVTPHPFHAAATIAAFENGLHVMCDKPIASKVGMGDEMIAAWRKSETKFSTMYSMRTKPINKVVKQWLDGGKVGDIRRVDMVCSGWLRSQRYYDDQTWRGTWAGEGSGLLLNQAPHNLDLLYWWFGPAKSISAKATCRFHDIETEDEVNAEIVNEKGFPIRFYSTTGEAPGFDRVEIVGTKGTLIRDETLIFRDLTKDLDQAIRESDSTNLVLNFEEREIEVPKLEYGHKIVFRDFFDAILNDRANESLISPGDEGIHSLEWANAMLLSSIEKRDVSPSVDRRHIDTLIEELICGKIKLSGE